MKKKLPIFYQFQLYLILGRGYNININPEQMTAVPKPPAPLPGQTATNGGLPTINAVNLLIRSSASL